MLWQHTVNLATHPVQQLCRLLLCKHRSQADVNQLGVTAKPAREWDSCTCRLRKAFWHDFSGPATLSCSTDRTYSYLWAARQSIVGSFVSREVQFWAWPQDTSLPNAQALPSVCTSYLSVTNNVHRWRKQGARWAVAPNNFAVTKLI